MARLSGTWVQLQLTSIVDVLPIIALIAIPALLGVLAVPYLARLPKNTLVLVIMIAAGLAMRLVWFGLPVVIDDDYYRYLWDGAVLASGHNPYAVSPKHALGGIDLPAGLAPLAGRAGDILRGVNFPEMTTIYPGTAQLGFALAALIAPLKLDGLRIVFLVAEAATLILLIAILKDLSRPPIMAALYWLNPLIVWSVYGAVHSEALLAPLLLGAILLAWRGRLVLAAALLAFAVGVKIWPILLIPLFARLAQARGQPLWPPAVAFASVSAILLLPLAHSAATGANSGLVAYSDHWWINNGPFTWVSYWVYQLSDGWLGAQRILRAVISASVGVLALYLARRPPADLRDFLGSALIVSAATFYMAPAQFPWYAMWFLPLAAVLESRPLLLASATLATYYVFHPLAIQGIGWTFSYLVAFLHSLPVWGWLAWNWWQGQSDRQARAPIR